VPDNGIALERREAPGPTLLGPRARKRQPLVTGDLPWRAPNPGFGFGNRRRSAGGASRRSIPLLGKRKKGNGGPARAPEFKARVREALAECKRSMRAHHAFCAASAVFTLPWRGPGGGGSTAFARLKQSGWGDLSCDQNDLCDPWGDLLRRSSPHPVEQRASRAARRPSPSQALPGEVDGASG
jgi:hypothetical protein